MHIDNIPLEIVVRVFQTITAPCLSTNENWTGLLPLLATCRKWRLLALPLVYKQAIIELTSNPEHKETASTNYKYTLDSDYCSATPANGAQIRSNLPILPDTCRHMPRRLLITVDYPTALCAVIQDLVGTLRLLSHFLQNIYYLKIRFSQNDIGLHQPAMNIDINVKNARIAANGVSRYLPCVNKLDVDTNSYCPVFLEFDKTLTCAYASQLTVLTTTPTSLTVNFKTTNKLYDLTVRFMGSTYTNNTKSTMSINTESLKHLGLLGFTDADFPWDMLSSSEKSTIANLPNLESLNMLASHRISETNDEINDPELWLALSRKITSSVLAPKLSHIYADICPSTCSFIMALPTNHCLKKLGLSICEDIDVWLDNVVINHRVKMILERHSKVPIAKSSWVELANDIYAVPNFFASSAIYISNCKIDTMDIDSFIWPTISRLDILVSLHIGNMIKFIVQLPNLSVLKVSRMYFGVPFDSVKGFIQNLKHQGRIDSNMNQIDIGFDDIPLTDELKALLCDVLYTLVDSLKKITYLGVDAKPL